MSLDVYGIVAKHTYLETLRFLDEKSWSFAEMKPMITLVSFLYGKTESEIRSDLWTIRKIDNDSGMPMAAPNP